METARRVQAHLLPPPEVRLGCVQVAGRSLPSGPVGGDVYDVRLLADDRVGVLVVDLSGHNVAAALHTAMVRAIVWREAEQADGPGEVLARLNERLCQDLPDEHFATAFFGWFDLRSSRLRYANAGHPPALLRQSTGHSRELGPTMSLLGILPDLLGSEAAVEVGPGSRLLVYTDGLTETEGPRGDLWGACELATLLETEGPADPMQLIDRILEQVAAFRGERSQGDDLTVMLAAYDPATATRREEECRSDRGLDSPEPAPYASIIPFAHDGREAVGYDGPVLRCGPSHGRGFSCAHRGGNSLADQSTRRRSEVSITQDS
jgi:sigma-B regulation protein RsbU (phosphoserine phosphatase)